MNARLRLAVLTTDTLHHRYFLRQLWNGLPSGAELVLNIFESRPYPWSKNARKYFLRRFPDLWNGLLLNPYVQPNTAARMNAYEQDRFFPDSDQDLPEGLTSLLVHSVNGDEARTALSQAAPDLILVYGTGLVEPDTFGLARIDAINAHGGKIPGYRGLDTNLWAAYEGRPALMTATLHRMDKNFDTGPIFLERPIGTPSDLSIYTLRYHTTIIAIEMFLTLIEEFCKSPPVPKPQDLSGSDYYGPMPWFLKLKTDRKLRAYAASNQSEAHANA